eukprot:10171494-Karenia_brevis.AAC.1
MPSRLCPAALAAKQCLNGAARMNDLHVLSGACTSRTREQSRGIPLNHFCPVTSTRALLCQPARCRMRAPRASPRVFGCDKPAVRGLSTQLDEQGLNSTVTKGGKEDGPFR